MDNYDIINIPEMFMNYITLLIPLINKWGVIQIFEKLSLFIGQQLVDYFKNDKLYNSSRTFSSALFSSLRSFFTKRDFL